MINLFTNITASDQSIKYLGQLFGNMSGVIPTGSEYTVIGAMFRAFNSVVLAIGVLIIIYITVMGVIHTAHEGKFMGERWSNLWVPIRTVLGIATLIPTVSGFSAIQIVMMWVILQGIGAANFLWTTALSAINELGSPYAQADASPPTGDTRPTLQKLFRALTCNATANWAAADPTNTTGGKYYCAETGDCGQTLNVTSTSNSLAIGPKDGACGTLSYCDEQSDCANATSTTCYACKAQIQALNLIIGIFNGVATQVVAADYQYRDFYANSKNLSYTKAPWITDYCASKGMSSAEECCVPGNEGEGDCKGKRDKFPQPNAGKPDAQDPQGPSSEAVTMYQKFALKNVFATSANQKNFIDTALDQYTTLLKNSVGTAIASSSIAGTEFEKASNDGWLLAGSYYYSIAQVNNKTVQSTVPKLDVPYQNIGETVLSGYRNNYSAGGELVGAPSGGSKDLTSGSQQVMGNGMSDVAQAFNVVASSGTSINPLSQLQVAGYTMLVAAQAMYAAFLAITITVGIAGNLSFWILGTGTVNPVGPAALLVYLIVMPLFYAVLGFLITFGGMLAIYIPLIPFIVFTFGAIGWFIAVIETMVAGPIVALGLLSPSNQTEILGNAQGALMLLFNVFLRPTLMIFGLLTAMTLVSVVVLMLNYAFWNPVFVGIFSFGESPTAGGYAAASAAAALNPVAFFLFLAAYVMTVVTAINKCFSLIHILPQQVMSWIGSSAMPGGAETGAEALSAAKGATDKAGGTAVSGMTTAGKAASPMAQAIQKKKASESEMDVKASDKQKKK